MLGLYFGKNNMESTSEVKVEAEVKKVDGRFLKKEGDTWVLLCSDCKKVMPNSGFVSPESSEMRHITIGDKNTSAIEALEKPVCLECYYLAFKRVYPNEELPKLSSDIS